MSLAYPSVPRAQGDAATLFDKNRSLVKLISNSFDIHFIASRFQEIRQGVLFAGEIILFLRYGNVAYL